MASFYDYLPLLPKVEAGYQKLAKDGGNYNSLGQLVGTNFGISAKTYEKWIKRVPSELDMRSMLKATAIEIYLKWYWNPLKCDAFNNQSVANLLFDHCINAGQPKTVVLLQQVLVYEFRKNIKIDGLIGTQTISAANSVNQELLFEKIKDYREAYYRNEGGTFLSSWLNRLNFFFFKKRKPAQQ